MMTGLGLGMAAVGYYSVKSATNFQQSMEMIKTQAGGSQKEVNQLTAAILKMGQSGQYAQTPQQMADALFHLESVGIRLNKGVLPDLKSSLQAAAVGNVNAEEATSALAAAWVATGRKGGAAFKDLAGLINATVGTGNMRMGQLVEAMGRGVIPAFQAVGLNVHDAMGALAIFTDAGYQASSAAAQVSTALHFLEQPSTKADKYLRAIGMTQYQMAEDLHKPRGLLTALTDLRSHLMTLQGGLSGVDAGQVMSALFPGGRGRIMLTLIQNLGAYSTKLDTLDKLQKQYNSDVTATHHTMAFKLHAAWAQITTDLVLFGDKLLPIVAKYLPMLVGVFSSVFGWLTRLPSGVQSFLVKLTGLMLVLGPMLILVGKLVGAYKALREAMYLMRGAGIAAGEGEAAAAAGGGAGLLGRFGLPALSLFAASQFVHPMERAAKKRDVTGAAIQGGIMGGLAGVGSYGAAGALLGTPLGPPGMIVGGLGGAAAGAGVGVLHALGILHKGGPVGIPRFQTGGYLGADNVPALLQLGEGVLNRQAMGNLGVGGLNALNAGMPLGGGMMIQPGNVFVQLDGRVIARAVVQYTLRAAARGPSSLVGGSLMTGTVGPVSSPG